MKINALCLACILLASSPLCLGQEFQLRNVARFSRPTEMAELAMASSEPFEDPLVLESANGILNVSLDVVYATNSIDVFDENTGQRKPARVHLRSYNGALVGPTLVAKPGDLLKIQLKNSLPLESNSDQHGSTGAGNIPHGFNTTNLHTHGLHVSPAGNSDNVLLQIPPGGELEYEIKIPSDHPPGTFWYHAHKHGSTAIQVSSGMAGMLIIKGGLDQVSEIASASEHAFVFQQVPFVLGADGIGRIENFRESFGRGTWDRLQRFTTINGSVLPVLRLKPGEVQRWRLVHAGNRESIKLRVSEHQLQQIAFDGLAAGRKIPTDTVELHPGYRVDVLIKASSTPGEYLLVDERIEALGNASGANKERKYVGKLIVEGDAQDMPLPSDDSLSGLIPHRAIADNELTGFQSSFFTTDFRASRQLNQDLQFFINYRSFEPQNPTKKLRLNSVDEWVVGSRTIDSASPPSKAGHIYHIHVNPFEIVAIRDENGQPKDITARWKDTIFLPDGYTITFRTRYTRYVGSFMLHCHMLEHEDQGMMEIVEIVLSDRHEISQLHSSPLALKDVKPTQLASYNGKTRLLVFIKGEYCKHCMAQLDKLRSGLPDKSVPIIVVTPSKINPELLRGPFAIVVDANLKLFREYGAFDNGPVHGTFLINERNQVILQNTGDVPFTDFQAIEQLLENPTQR
jgi:FtsP/CotA-like multicopper oxidase with cupredoxin domain